MMTNVMQSPGNQGFMVIPRSMLREIFRELGDGCPLTDTAAYPYMLYTACYTERPPASPGRDADFGTSSFALVRLGTDAHVPLS